MSSRLSFSTWQQFWLNWYRYNHILRLLHERTELEELLVWAKRKGILRKVGKSYRYKLCQTEMELADLCIRYPQVTRWAYFLYWVSQRISAEPRYFKGYAAKYRHNGQFA